MRGAFEMQNKQSGKKPGPAKPGPGRPKGSVNKTTALLKDAILQAAETAGGSKGTVGYLTEQAKKNPQVFIPLLGKVLPMQVQLDGAIRIQRVNVTFVDGDKE